jgi:hypothetical protein
MKKWFIAITLLLFIFPALIYTSLPSIAAYAVKSWLVEQGFQKPVFTLDYPDHKTIQISELRVEKHTTNRISTLNAGPVRISYSPWNLIFKGQLSRIEIPTASLDVLLLGDSESTTKTDETPASLAPVSNTEPTDLRQFIPKELLLLAPAQELVVGQLDIRFRATDKPLYQLTGNLSVRRGEQLLSRVLLSIDDQSVARADLVVTSDSHIQLTAHQYELPFFKLRASLNSENQHLVLTADHYLALNQVSQLLDKLKLLPDKDWHIQKGEWVALTTITASRELTSLDDWLSSIKAEQSFEIDASAALPNLPFKSINSELLALWQYSKVDGLRLTAYPKSKIDLHSINSANMVSDKVSLQLSTPLEFDLLQQKLLKPASFEITNKALKYADWTLDNEPLLLHLNSADVEKHEIALTLNSNRIRLAAGKNKPLSFALKGNVESKQEELLANLHLTGSELPVNLTTELHTQLKDSNTSVKWQLKQLPLSDRKKRWTTKLPITWPQKLTITAGTYTNSGEVSWSEGRANGYIKHAVEGLDLTYDKIELKNGNFDSKVMIRNNRLDDNGKVSIESVDAGVVISQLNADYRINKLGSDNAILDLKSFSADLLDGSVNISPFYTVMNAPAFKTSVSLNELSLDELLKLEQEQGLYGEGRLSGNLPLRYNDAGFSVSKGFIKTNGKGVIRYQPTDEVLALGQSNQGMSMALAALENFHYSSLSAEVNYAPNGNLVLATQLQGANPDWNQGHPVNFTINISENLHKLLKSLQFAEDLTQQIETRYRKP